MTRDEIRARFRRVVARGLKRAERQEREHLERIRRLPGLSVEYNPSGARKGTARTVAAGPWSGAAPADALAVAAVLDCDPDDETPRGVPRRGFVEGDVAG